MLINSIIVYKYYYNTTATKKSILPVNDDLNMMYRI